MDEHHYGAVFDAEVPERTIQLLMHLEGRCGVRKPLTVYAQQGQRVPVASLPAPLGVARVDEQPMNPGVEAIRISQLGQVAPRFEQRLLRRILSQRRVAEDASRDGVQRMTDAFDQLVERLLVAVHGPLDQFPLHAAPVSCPSQCATDRSV